MEGKSNDNENGNSNTTTTTNNNIGKYVGVALAVVGVAVKLAMLYSGSENVGKMMKAPGKPGIKIPRNVFESDPSSYFRNLRKN